jgi:hypothetical protein
MRVDGRPRRRRFPGGGAARLGLVGLAASAWLPVGAGAQQGRPLSFEEVREAVAAGNAARVLEQVRADCVSFAIDTPTEARLRAAGADPRFIAGLRDVCHVGSSLQVTTDPPGAEVWLQRTLLGRTPLVSPVPPAKGAVIEVRHGDRWRRMVTDLPADRLVRVQIALPLDTLPWPTGPAAAELQALRQLASGFDPARPLPPPPTPPTRGNSVRSMLVGGLVGAAAGVAAGTMACRRDVYLYTRDPLTGVRRNTGTSAELSGGCLGFSSVIGIAGGGLAGRYWSGRSWQRRQQQYAAAARAHERAVAQREEQRKAAQTLREQAARVAEQERVAAENARRKRANEALDPPVVRVEAPIWLQRATIGAPDR